MGHLTDALGVPLTKDAELARLRVYRDYAERLVDDARVSSDPDILTQALKLRSIIDERIADLLAVAPPV